MHKEIQAITDRIIARSKKSRAAYLSGLEQAKRQGPQRKLLSCGNLAHGFAACPSSDKEGLRGLRKANIAIVSAYNDVLSAHQPYSTYPTRLKEAIRQAGGVAQFAGGVPAMCDGVTQGQPGMELSLLSRDVIALSAAIALSHNLFDGGLMLGICDKIVPGLLIAALRFGHLPFIFIPAGPMPSGISNQKKAEVRQLYAEKKADWSDLLEAEAASYHSAGTCTFYGTANSNQVLVELMGLQLPGSSFIPPNTPLRAALTDAAGQRIVSLTSGAENDLPLGRLVEEKTVVNAMVGLLATGGSTNHTIHLIAIAAAAGIQINWDDFASLSRVTPLLTRIYPNGEADINAFQKAGGMAYLIHHLLEAELLHPDVHTSVGFGLEHYTRVPVLKNKELQWLDGPKQSSDTSVLTCPAQAFNSQGGLQVLSGNLGRAIMKTSALKEEQYRVEAEAVVFLSQEALETAFRNEELNKDAVIVLPYQGPKACGMPELHQLTPILSVLQNRGFKVALVTDGRMSGASGKVPAAIHLTPEALDGGLIAKIQSGDRILVDGKRGCLQLQVSSEELARRSPMHMDLSAHYQGLGRELFGNLRQRLGSAEQGACSLFSEESE